MHTYIHTYIHTCIHIHTHTYMYNDNGPTIVYYNNDSLVLFLKSMLLLCHRRRARSLPSLGGAGRHSVSENSA